MSWEKEVLSGEPLWMRFAACRGADQSIFFINKGERPTDGLAVCAECPVKLECGAYADKFDVRQGIWGGENRGDRSRRRRRRST